MRGGEETVAACPPSVTSGAVAPHVVVRVLGVRAAHWGDNHGIVPSCLHQALSGCVPGRFTRSENVPLSTLC